MQAFPDPVSGSLICVVKSTADQADPPKDCLAVLGEQLLMKTSASSGWW